MHFFQVTYRVPRCSLAFVSLVSLCGAGLLAGCGGSSSDSSTARIRAFDASPNGGTATIFINGGAVSGSQTFAGGSSYQYAGNGVSSATFTHSANPGITYPTISQNFTVGSFYTLIAAGRADITSPADPRYPSLIVALDTLTAPPDGLADVRAIQTAPDAGSVDVLVDGAVIASGAAYKSVSNYVNISAGNATIQVNLAGTNTILAGPQSLVVTAGHVYTVLVEEPTTLPAPAYGIQGLDDTSNM